MNQTARKWVEVTVVGPDRKGIVAGVTGFVFKHRGNIERINQNVIGGLFGMQMEASFNEAELNEKKFRGQMAALGRKLGMEIKLHVDDPSRPRNMAVLVTKEPHCLEAILAARARGDIRVDIRMIAGTEKTLAPLAARHKIPFFEIDHSDQARAEREIMKLLERYNIDFVALARYMRILSPNFVWRYPNRIINIHPSLLPAFAGAYAYVKAYERGAQIVGCTAHFVTEELDEGPIIWQESFRVEPEEDLESIKRRGKDLEARALLAAVRLYLENRLEVYWGKVHIKPRQG